MPPMHHHGGGGGGHHHGGGGRGYWPGGAWYAQPTTYVVQACPELYDPVIGTDGVTYSNSCYANAAGVAVAGRAPRSLPSRPISGALGLSTGASLAVYGGLLAAAAVGVAVLFPKRYEVRAFCGKKSRLTGKLVGKFRSQGGARAAAGEAEASFRRQSKHQCFTYTRDAKHDVLV